MNICVIFGEYSSFNAKCIKEIKSAKRVCKPDLMCVFLTKNIKNDGTFLNSNPLFCANEATNNGADIVIGIPSIFTLCNKELYSFALLKILRLFGSDNKYFLACPVDDENMEYIEMADAMLVSESNDGFLTGNNVMKVNKVDEQDSADISNMLTGISNEIFAETYYNGIKMNLDINLIPILKKQTDEDIGQIIDYNKFILLYKNILGKTSPDIIKKHLSYVTESDNDEETTFKLGIPLLLQFDLDKEKIINYIKDLDKVELLAVKKNKKKLINSKVFIENLDSEFNSYEEKIKGLYELLK